MKSLETVNYDRLAVVLSEHERCLSVEYDGMQRNEFYEIQILQLHISQPDGEPAILYPHRAPEPSRHPEYCRIEGGEAIIRVRDRSEALQECARYDLLKWFGDSVIPPGVARCRQTTIIRQKHPKDHTKATRTIGLTW